METGEKKSGSLENGTANSQDFITTILSLYGDQGRKWLASLPETIEQCADHWKLTNIVVGKHLSYHYIATAHSSLFNLPVVIKIGFDSHALAREQTALQLYNGNGCVRLLAADKHNQALLLEHLIPGTSLTSLFPHDDLLAVDHTAALLQQLHATTRSPASSLELLTTLLSTFEHAYDAILPAAHLAKAEQLLQNLLATQTDMVVLHADLHQGNILKMGNGYKAIDPKGMIGDPAYDVGPFIRNPLQLLIEHEQARNMVSSRIERFAQCLSLDAQRIAAWCYVQSIIAACWHWQDNSGTDAIDDCVRMAELIASLR